MFRSFTLATLLFAIPCSALADDWTFDKDAAALRPLSCIGDTASPDRITVQVEDVALGETEYLPERVSFLRGWALSSEDWRFGGLSGLAVTDDGSLLTVSDMGRALRFNIPEDGAISALVWDLRRANGRSLTGKLTGDAEGLTLEDGLAFVSFERDFRVLAYDMKGCGAAARGIPIAEFPARYGKTRIRANAGPESLELTKNGKLRIGFEQPLESAILTGLVERSGAIRFETVHEEGKLLQFFRHVGADTVTLEDGRIATARLLRAYDRRLGNRSILDIQVGEDQDRISLEPPQAVDNFEGIALTETDSGVRAFIVSDDNFSDRQRTLLFAFDLRLD
ncbi:MAG: esterase-like activity of phytase family protein [Litorimonas sp.]